MIFIKDFIKITDEKYSIYVHYMPFDKERGYKINEEIATEEQLLEIGKLVELPKKLPYVEGKVQVLYYNPQTNTCFYEYIDIPKTKEDVEKETFTQTLAELTIENKKKDAMIANLAETVASLTIQVNQLKGSVQ